MHPLTLGTFASGGLDGIAAAAQELNIEVKFHCEIDPRRREMLRQLYGKDAVIYHDVRTMGEQQPPKVDIIGITAPCTSFSIAGKRKGFDDPNGQLLLTTLDRINELRPKYFILENSPQLLNTQGSKQVFNRIAEIGYNAEWTCLPLTTFGLPTQRGRLYLVAWLPDITSNMQSGRYELLQEPRKMQNLPAGWWSGTPDLLAILGRVRQARATLDSPTNVGLFTEGHFNENTQHQEVPQNDYFAHLPNNELNRLIAAAGDSISPRAAKWLLQSILDFDKKHL